MQPSASSTTADPRFLQAAREGLMRPGQKWMPSEFLYDEVGTALFEAITVLPEYGLTRADRRLLENNSDAIAARLRGRVSVIELGSGSGTKTAHVLRALLARQSSVDYFPIDVSRAALERCSLELAPLATVNPVQAGFVEGIRRAAAAARAGERVLALFLGSTIGNFNPEQAPPFLREVRDTLKPGDMLLVGADLVKPVDRLLLAYDDPAGVTAAFNLNLLGRMNRELGANFDLRRFRHVARYDARAKRIEMHLSSMDARSVEIAAAGCAIRFEADETVWTESSRKYDVADLEGMCDAAGFRTVATWMDREWPFVESLWER